MALRLRRGTEAERLQITPLEGELVYITDTKRLYIGDGSTTGGIAILDPETAGIALANLIDVDTTDGSTIPGDGELLAYDADNQRWRPVPVSSNVNNIGDLGDVDLTVTPVDNDILRYDAVAGNWTAEALANVPINITDLADVDTQSTLPVNGDILQWDGNSLRWIPVPLSLVGGGITEGNEYYIKVTDPSGNLVVDGSQRLLRGDLYNDAGQAVVRVNARSVTADIKADSGATVLLRGTNGNDAEFRGTVKGELIGSIIGGDSTIFLDDTGKFVGSAVETPLISTDNLIAGTVRIAGDTGNNVISTTTAGTSLILTALSTTAQVVSTRPLTVGGTGATVPSSFINIFNTDNDGVPLRIISAFDNSGESRIAINRSRGTKAAPTAVQTGDGLGSFLITGHNGVGYRGAGGMRVVAAGSPQAARIPGEVQLFTVTTGGLPDPVITFGIEKNTSFAGAVKPGVYADATARDAAITGPELGMMIFNVGLDKFQGYTSTGWVDLN